MIDLSDGVDCVRHCIYSEKGAPHGDYEPCDGSIRMCLDEMWDTIQEDYFVDPEGALISLYLDVLGHEWFHKMAVWGMGEDFVETFNEMDERVMRVCSDWYLFDKMSKMTDYDWKH